jgi:hypothetical protein
MNRTKSILSVLLHGGLLGASPAAPPPPNVLFISIVAGKLYPTSVQGGQPESEFQETAPRTWVGYGPLPEKKLNYAGDPAVRLRDWGAFPARDEEQSDYAIADYAGQ